MSIPGALSFLLGFDPLYLSASCDPWALPMQCVQNRAHHHLSSDNLFLCLYFPFWWMILLSALLFILSAVVYWVLLYTNNYVIRYSGVIKKKIQLVFVLDSCHRKTFGLSWVGRNAFCYPKWALSDLTWIYANEVPFSSPLPSPSGKRKREGWDRGQSHGQWFSQSYLHDGIPYKDPRMMRFGELLVWRTLSCVERSAPVFHGGGEEGVASLHLPSPILCPISPNGQMVVPELYPL